MRCPCGCGGFDPGLGPDPDPMALVGMEIEPGVFVAAEPEVMARAVNAALERITLEERILLGIMGELLPPVPGYRYTPEYLLEPEPEPASDRPGEDPDPWQVGPDGEIWRGGGRG